MSSSLYSAHSFVFIFIFTMSINSIVPINPSRISISQIPYPPPTLTKHHIWYSNTADLFVTICGALFGLHRAYFNHLQHFQMIMDTIKPGQLMAQGNVPLYPIPFDDLNPLLFHQFLQFFSHMPKFCRTKWDWEDIWDISIDWYLPQQTAIATWKLVDICWHSFSPTQRLMLQGSVSYHIVNRQQWKWQQLYHDVDSSDDSDNDVFIEDNYS